MPRKIYRRRGVKRTGRKLTRKQLSQVKRIVKSNVEMKVFTYTYNLHSVSNSAFLDGSPFDIPQGVTGASRVGDSLTWVGKIHFRYRLAIGDKTNIVRLAIVQYHPQSTTTPTPVDLDIYQGGLTSAVDVFSLPNFDNRHNYTILWDKTHQMIGDSFQNTSISRPNTQSSEIYHTVNISLRKARKHVEYVNGSLQGTNRLFLFYVSDSQVTFHPSLTASIRVQFTDS